MAATSSTDPEVGHRAPAFKLPRDGGAKASLADYKGRYLVLYFYPKANTTGCTKEAIDFSRLKPRFAKLGADVRGVSADPVPALDKFRDKHDLTVALASDEDKAMLKDYGAWGKKSMYGRSFMGVIRKTVLIGPDGKVIKVWPKVKVPGHAEEVLVEVQAAAKGVTAK
ncbi:MAG: peroxiredoxin [Pseudolabrys sp.]